MNLKYFFILLSFCIVPPAFAANAWITSSDIDKVYASLGASDWPALENTARALITRKSPAQENTLARMRYIYLYSVYKQMESGKLAYADFVKKTNLVLHENVLQPWHPVKSGNSVCFNLICDKDVKKGILWTAQTNEDATQIYAFEYFDAGYPVSIASYDGQDARLGGVVNKIEVNPNLKPAMASNRNVTWYLRLRFKNAYIQYEK